MTTKLRGHEVNARMFLDKPTIYLIPSHGVRGLTVLNDGLFFVEAWSREVNVYNTNTFTPARKIEITGSQQLSVISGSLRYNCLYIGDEQIPVVHRYYLPSNDITQWNVGGMCSGLSETSTGSVLVTLVDNNQIKKYTTDGSLIREISLDISMEHPHHSVQLSSDRLVVSHGSGESLHRVCVVDMSGRIIQSYGEYKGSGIGLLNEPSQLEVDGYGNVLVADWGNERVVLLSISLISLTHLGYITVPGHRLRDPYALHLDPLNRRLYIGERDSSSGRVIVITV